MSRTPHIPGQDAPAAPRFQIASRLGGFRDTATLADPFGTSGHFVVNRHGSNAHKAWFRSRVDSDPITMVMTEAALTADAVVLTPEEVEIVSAARRSDTPNPLLPVVDRLSFSAGEQEMRRAAIRNLMATGRVTASDMATRGEDEMLEEALFVLRAWHDLPDADGGTVPFSTDAARALLTNDTPLDGAGIDELILQVDAWTVEIEEESEVEPPLFSLPQDPPSFEDGKWHWKSRHIIPGLTLGRAYQLFFLRRSRDLAIFRDKVMGAAGKNSPPLSGSTGSPGGGSSDAVAV